jgi:hypothetical protein
MTTTKLNLSDKERTNLRKHKVKINELLDYEVDELAAILEVSEKRARELYALADFQRVPSIGIRFAEDLIFLGYYRIEELRERNGASLTDDYEKAKGYRIDSCVEDQFRLVVDYANKGDRSKRWWDFTSERKQFRKESGYPKDRPQLNWQEVLP